MGKFKDGKELGQIVKQYRLETGMSTRELSRQIHGVSEYYISQLERGQSKKNPNFDAIIQAFRILGLSDEEINMHIPLEEFEAEKKQWLSDKVNNLAEQAKNMPKEYKLKLIEAIQRDLEDSDKVYLRINKGDV